MSIFTKITLIDFTRSLSWRQGLRKIAGPYQWHPSEAGKGRGFYQATSGLHMDRHGSPLNLRLEWANDHLSGNRLWATNGYFADDDCSGDTLQPIIARLPNNRGFLAGWTMGPGMCATLDGTVWATEYDAAKAAHRLADYDATMARIEADHMGMEEAA